MSRLFHNSSVYPLCYWMQQIKKYDFGLTHSHNFHKKFSDTGPASSDFQLSAHIDSITRL